MNLFCNTYVDVGETLFSIYEFFLMVDVLMLICTFKALNT